MVLQYYKKLKKPKKIQIPQISASKASLNKDSCPGGSRHLSLPHTNAKLLTAGTLSLSLNPKKKKKKGRKEKKRKKVNTKAFLFPPLFISLSVAYTFCVFFSGYLSFFFFVFVFFFFKFNFCLF
jgi:hypothetical protein